jgi:hypothetical protein
MYNFKKIILSISIIVVFNQLGCFWVGVDKLYYCTVTWPIVLNNQSGLELNFRLTSETIVNDSTFAYDYWGALADGEVFCDSIFQSHVNENYGCKVLGTKWFLTHLSFRSSGGGTLFDSIDINPFENTPYQNGQQLCNEYPPSSNPDFDYECNYTMYDTITILPDTIIVKHVGN